MKKFRGGKSYLKAFLAGLFVIAAMPLTAHAQGAMCAPAERMLTWLAEKHDEQPIGGGILSGGFKSLITTSPDGKSFTILFFNKDGLACLLATGTGFALAAPPSSTEKEG
jgi:hypothetical protein